MTWKLMLSGHFFTLQEITYKIKKKRFPCGRTENTSVYSNLLV